MRKKLPLYLSTFAALIFTLLVGNRFGFVWAGGDGYEPHPSVTIGNTTYHRGDVVSSNETDFLDLGRAAMWLDENTEVKLLSTQADNIELQVIQGRVVVGGSATISVREVFVETNGVTSFTHYSWLDDVEIANIEGTATLTINNESSDLTGTALRFHTLPPYDQEAFDFSPETSSASEFYQRVLD